MATPETRPMTASNEIKAASGEGASTDTEMMVSLIFAAYKGDWETARKIFDREPILLAEATSTDKSLEILEAAAMAGQWEFFDELVQLTNAQTLAILFPMEKEEKKKRFHSILHLVANLGGNMKSAKALVDKNPSLTQLTDSSGFTPLYTAINSTTDKDLAWYLTLVTTDEDPGRPFTGHRAGNLLYVSICAGFYEITHFLLQRHPYMAEILFRSRSSKGIAALSLLASMPSEFPSTTKLGWLESCIYLFIPVEVDHFQPPSHLQQQIQGSYSSNSNHQTKMQISVQSETNKVPAFKSHKFRSLIWNLVVKLVPRVQRIQDTKFKHKCAMTLVNIACERANWKPTDYWQIHFPVIKQTLEAAASSGVIEILSTYLKYFPLPEKSLHQGSLLCAAIEYRQDEALNFFLRNRPGLNSKLYINEELKNTLHMVAKSSSCPKVTSIPGAAFQMQKELQWFKGIEKLVLPSMKQEKNKHGDTPWEFFKKEHQHMREEGEKWMKDTSNFCMLVATLIATVVFAAAFTVPGGSNQDNGTPIFLHKNMFMLFVVFDALALFSSVNSIWMFLSILTARFAEEDFLKTLPKRLIIGLATLFLAIVSTITAFCVALSLVLGQRGKEIFVLIVLMAFVSVATFARLQLPLFTQMVRSTYYRSLFGS